MPCKDTADRVIDIEELNAKWDAEIGKVFEAPTREDVEKYRPMVHEMLDLSCTKTLATLRKEYGFAHKNSFLYQIFDCIKFLDGNVSEEQEAHMRQKLRIKKGKSHSGIISITVFTSSHPAYTDPGTGERKVQPFSCAWNCAYCPNEPGQPRSYLKGEPGVLRANRCNFDCVDQMNDRMNQLFLTGHPIDKLEVLVLGGTLASYPHAYVEEFVRDIYYAANVFGQKEPRGRGTLTEEKVLNKHAKCRVVGLTLETRPDTITPEEIRRLRYYGCTRVQLGIQHIDDDILRKIRRQCTTETTIRAIQLLKDCGYKIDGHWMPNLPGSTVEKDETMLCHELLGVDAKTYEGPWHEVWKLRNEGLQVDQWKVYPCTLVPWTDIMDWYQKGEYVPYSQEELMDLLLKMKALVFPWIRLNRVIRDIPSDYVVKSDYRSNLRQELNKVLAHDGWYCACIRCREVKGDVVELEQAVLKVREYNASGGREFFLSMESRDVHAWKLYGFVRLRLGGGQGASVFPELAGCALIRELHVYGQLATVGQKTSEGAAQHRGVGKRLMKKAEEIALENKYTRISVIAGEGVRGYYEKLGYQEDPGKGHFMIKTL